MVKERKRAKIRNRYNQVPHLTKDITRESDMHTIRHHKREPRVSPYPAVDHKASINRRARKYNKHKTEITQMIQKRSTALERSVKIFYWKA